MRLTHQHFPPWIGLLYQGASVSERMYIRDLWRPIAPGSATMANREAFEIVAVGQMVDSVGFYVRPDSPEPVVVSVLFDPPTCFSGPTPFLFEAQAIHVTMPPGWFG